MTEAGVTARLVIQRNTVDYLAPIAGDFTARCAGLPEDRLAAFLRTLARHGRARAELAATLEYDGAVAARFAGEFVAIRSS
jgi:thioesterase domain-containing protein